MEQITQQIEKRDELGRFVIGSIPRHKGIGLPQIKGENHYRWKGGNRKTAKRIAKEYGMDFKHCQICKEETDKPVIHHINGNYFDNERKNLSILCHFCHNAIHDNPNRKKTQFKKGHEVSKEVREKIGRANSK
jgi:hypothetical protein